MYFLHANGNHSAKTKKDREKYLSVLILIYAFSRYLIVELKYL